jgi:hypothetical protein
MIKGKIHRELLDRVSAPFVISAEAEIHLLEELAD